MELSEIKYVDSTWDFRTANTKTYTHCYHNYPAMMIPQIAERLLVMYGKNAKTLFDPYCGTGTSLVEANLKNIHAIGTDLNPLAQLISKTKTAKINLQTLESYLKTFNNFLFFLNFASNTPNITIPNFKNIHFWFSETVLSKLAIIKQFIDEIADKDVKNFFYVAFSETVRESSFTRNSEFKLYRMPEKQRKTFNPDIFAIISSKLARNKQGLIKYLDKTKNFEAKTQIFDFNTVESITNIPKESIDLIITSPPYGDSKTTVAYGQFSRLANQWLEVEEANQIDNYLMGGKTKNIRKIGINVIDEIVEKVAEKDIKRAKEIYSFYQDYNDSINNISTVLAKNAYVCYVVGNRSVKGINLPTDEITKTLFEVNNFKHINTFIRNIPNKRMPSQNSPTNRTGEVATTMNKEYIVVMRKSYR